MKRHSNSGQATVEFALMLPLFFACVLLIAGVMSACLQVLSLNDAARAAVRVAVTADRPDEAVTQLLERTHMSGSVHTDASGISTVTVEQPFRLWFLSIPIAQLHLRASSSMMKEPPVVLG